MVAANHIPGRVLVVDDQPANLRAISTLLSRHGYEVATADCGDAALQSLSVQPPDLILLDMLMPGMDGFELLGELRQRDAWRDVPVVFLTVAHDRDLLLRAFEAGAVDYVTKPFMPEELLARVNAHLGLKLTRDRLRRVAHERQQLVNLVAHDLKNPLSTIHFASDLLLSGRARPERVPRYQRMIRDSAEDALGYIRRYLEAQAERARAGNDTVQARASLHEVLAWLEERYALQLEERGARLRTKVCRDAPPVAIDPLVLRQVCENLVGNAMKYAPGSDVDLSVQPASPGFIQVRVEDRGPGIPPLRQDSLFKPFSRLGDDHHHDGRSSGLGLSLSRQIVDQAGGQLWYEDRDGGGACFVVELPVVAG